MARPVRVGARQLAAMAPARALRGVDPAMRALLRREARAQEMREAGASWDEIGRANDTSAPTARRDYERRCGRGGLD